MAETSFHTKRYAMWRRPALSAMAVNLICSTYVLLAFNAGFWVRLSNIFENDPLHVILFGAAVWMLTFFTLSLFTLPWLHRPVIAVIFLMSAGAAWYQDKLGILIDREMVQNIMNTTYTESKHLISPAYLWHMLLVAVLPAALIWVPRVTYPKSRHIIWKMPLTVIVSFTLTFGLVFTDLKANAAAIRENHDLMGAYQPGATIAAIARYAKMQLRVQNVVVQDLGTDATKGPLLTAASKPVVTVIFAGETARAQNFGLNGYDRNTTPELGKRNVVNYSDASSCGTSTAVSLPCMFSAFSQDEYSFRRFMASENLLDVLAHAGIDPIWWDNNTGDQRIATRTGATMFNVSFDPVACVSGECTDEVLLTKLAEILPNITSDTVVILHMVGSHGPTYYLRYPPEYAQFFPDCQTAELVKCSAEEVVNSYDNTILFTDHVLSKAINMLDQQDSVIPAMVFLSDHGESLGEKGLYLHAAPMFMAPEYQTKVPFVIWQSDRFEKAMGVSTACLNKSADLPISQDNLFHTVLGMMDIQTEVRDASLDLTAACRAKGGNA